MITKILITNFQKHESLELNFSSDLNVISGLTDMGKSCVFRAVSWVCNLCDISADDLRREGTDETSVKIWLQNDFQIERIRSNTVNRYILSKEGYADKVFDTFGKIAPEEIQQALGLKEVEIDKEKLNLNFASQDHLNFILDSDYSDVFKAKLFNKLTGNELLDVLFKDLNKESLSINRDIKETEEQINVQEEELAEYSLSYKSLKDTLCMVTEKHKALENDIKIYEELKRLSISLKENKESSDFVKFKIEKINVINEEKINDLKTNAIKLNNVVELTNKLISTHNRLKEIEKTKNQIKVLNINFENLKIKSTDLNQLQDIANKIRNISTKEQELDIQKDIIDMKILNDEAELKRIWEECGDICPLCKTEVKHG